MLTGHFEKRVPNWAWKQGTAVPEYMYRFWRICLAYQKSYGNFAWEMDGLTILTDMNGGICKCTLVARGLNIPERLKHAA